MDCFVASLLAMTLRETCPSPPSRIDVDEIAQQRIDLVVPAPAGKHPVMADAGLHVVDLAIGPNTGAEVLRCQGLADRADIVLLTLDRHQAHALDRGRVHRAAAMNQSALRQQMLL